MVCSALLPDVGTRACNAVPPSTAQAMNACSSTPTTYSIIIKKIKCTERYTSHSRTHFRYLL